MLNLDAFLSYGSPAINFSNTIHGSQGVDVVVAPSTQFDPIQVDFSSTSGVPTGSGPIKNMRAHTVFVGPAGAGLPGTRGRPGRIKAAAIAAWSGGARGSSSVPSVVAKKFIAALNQDENLAMIIEQVRLAPLGS